MALEAILRTVPPEMLTTLAVKKTGKEAWDSIKMIRMVVVCVCNAKAQSLHKEFEGFQFKDDETIDDFAMCLTSLINNLNILDDMIPEEKAVQKFMCIAPQRYSQVALSIETLIDLDTLSVEELTGRLKATEERFDLDAGGNVGECLLKSKEE